MQRSSCLAVSFLLVLTTAACTAEQPRATYATYADAERDGAVRRGWIPPYVPRSATDIAEVHDAFTILEIIAYEDLGFAKRGEGGKFVNQQEMMINSRGGIIGCGHPVGATGVAQVAEIACQLAGKAGDRQLKNPKTGLVHNLAAAGSSASVIVMGV